MVRSVVVSLVALATVLPPGGCVAYEPAAIDLATLAAETPPLPGGDLSFADAVAFALRHNPELQQLAAQARAAGADVPATELQAQWRSFDDMLAVTIDPVALLGLGQRGAAIDVATAREAAALQALAVARWRLIGRIAEIYAATSALAEVEPPDFTQDPEPFTRAGLASTNAAAMARGAVAAAAAERLALAADRSTLQAELRTLLGAKAAPDVALVPVAPTFPPLPPHEEGQLLRRPDLALAVAQYRVADAEFRSAVAEQYPALMLGPDIPLTGGAIDAMVQLRLPIGAGSRAVAAKENRAAARAMVVAAVLEAGNTAADMVRRHAAAEQRAAATTASAAASSAGLLAAEAALDVEVDAFERVAERAQMAMRDAMERREAVVASARARVQRAIAWGWPATEGTP